MMSDWNGDWEGYRNRACSSLLELFTVCFEMLKKNTLSKFIKKLRQFFYLHQESFLYLFSNVWLKWNLISYPDLPRPREKKTEWDLGTRLSEIGKFQNSKTLPISKGNMGRFSFHQNPGSCRLLNFRELPVANRPAFSKISIKEDNLAWYTQIFEKFSRKFFSVQLCTWKFPEISVEWFAFRKFNRFPGFWNFSGKFLYRLPLFLKFRKFWLNGRRLWCTRVAQYFQGIF